MVEIGDGLATGTDVVAAAESAVGQALERLGGRRPDLLCVCSSAVATRKRSRTRGRPL